MIDVFLLQCSPADAETVRRLLRDSEAPARPWRPEHLRQGAASVLVAAPADDAPGLGWLRRAAKAGPVLLILPDTLAALAPAALGAGASGLMRRWPESDELACALPLLARGVRVVDECFIDVAQTLPDHRVTLTLRERGVLELMARGQRNDDIAQALGISRSSVKRVVASLMAKLNATTRAQAVARALRPPAPHPWQGAAPTRRVAPSRERWG